MYSLAEARADSFVKGYFIDAIFPGLLFDLFPGGHRIVGAFDLLVASHDWDRVACSIFTCCLFNSIFLNLLLNLFFISRGIVVY
jgi:hypothetical protein